MNDGHNNTLVPIEGSQSPAQSAEREEVDPKDGYDDGVVTTDRPELISGAHLAGIDPPQKKPKFLGRRREDKKTKKLKKREVAKEKQLLKKRETERQSEPMKKRKKPQDEDVKNNKKNKKKKKKKNKTKRDEKHPKDKASKTKREQMEEDVECGYHSDQSSTKRSAARKVKALATKFYKRTSLNFSSSSSSTSSRQQGGESLKIEKVNRASSSNTSAAKKVNFDVEGKRERLRQLGRKNNRLKLMQERAKQRQARTPKKEEKGKEKVEQRELEEEEEEEEVVVEEAEAVVEIRVKGRSGKDLGGRSPALRAKGGSLPSSPKAEEWKEFLLTHFENTSLLEKSDASDGEFSLFMKEVSREII